MKFHLFDYRWKDESACEIQAIFDNKFGRKEIRIGTFMSMKVCTDKKKCAGSIFEDKWEKCSQNYKGKAKCELCRSKEKNFIFTAFDGFNQEHITDADLARIAGPHVVYFALFNKGLVKVGVSGKERKTIRQIEQGSHFTLYIAETPNGIIARQIETLIRNTGLADKIKPSQKKNFICPEITEADGKKYLINLFEEKKEALKEHENLKNYILKTPEFKSWKKIFGLHNIEKSNKKFHTVKLEKDESISGKIVAKKGHFLVIETPEELVSVCIKDYYGHEINFKEIPPGLKIKSSLQNTLF